MKQTDLDLEMQAAGVDRAKKRVAEAREKGRESWTSYGQRLISGAVKPVGDLLIREQDRAATGAPTQNARAYATLRERIDPYVAAFIATQVVFDSISQHVRASSTFIAVGRQIEWEIIAKAWSRREPGLVKKLRRDYFRVSNQNTTSRTRMRSRQKLLESGLRLAHGFERIWDDAEALRVGHCLVELIRSATGLIDLVTFRSAAHRTDTYVIPTAEAEQYIKQVLARTEVLSPVYLPMVVPPDDWRSPTEGGYRLGSIGQPLIKTDRASVAAQMTREQMPEVYAAINFLQGVPYRINRRVKAVYDWAWEHSIAIGDLPLSKDHEIPPLPDMQPGETSESPSRRAAMREWWLVANPLKRANIEAKSKRIHYARLKYLAEKFTDDNIFLPMNCDFRGRMYTQPTFLSYQGCDAARGLLQFGHGKPVSTPAARMWLKIQGANAYGIKGTLEERAAWVDAHARQILDAAKRPIESEWWREADEPWQFLSFCLEAYDLARDPKHVSHHICWQDGSNNGLQVLSLAWRDEVGGKATNCLPSARPNDIYQDVADLTISLLKTEQDPDKREWADQWRRFGIDRQTTKRVVMIVPYSGTIYSSVKYVRSWFLEAVGPSRPSPWHDATKPIGYLTRLVWRAIGEVVVKAREAMEWLRGVGEACIAADVDPTWISPTGFVVAQEYPDWSRCTVTTTVLRRVRMWQIRQATERRDRRKHLDAISPNWVHCLDAAGLVKTANLMRLAGCESLSTVHDGLGVLAADAELLARSLRLGWMDLFSTDVVGALRREVEARIGTKLPEPPAFGNLDPRALQESRYFFC